MFCSCVGGKFLTSPPSPFCFNFLEGKSRWKWKWRWRSQWQSSLSRERERERERRTYAMGVCFVVQKWVWPAHFFIALHSIDLSFFSLSLLFLELFGQQFGQWQCFSNVLKIKFSVFSKVEGEFSVVYVSFSLPF